jgi:hypothetical protein
MSIIEPMHSHFRISVTTSPASKPSWDELCYILGPKGVLGEDFPSQIFPVLKERETKESGAGSF